MAACKYVKIVDFFLQKERIHSLATTPLEKMHFLIGSESDSSLCPKNPLPEFSVTLILQFVFFLAEKEEKSEKSIGGNKKKKCMKIFDSTAMNCRNRGSFHGALAPQDLPLRK